MSFCKKNIAFSFFSKNNLLILQAEKNGIALLCLSFVNY